MPPFITPKAEAILEFIGRKRHAILFSATLCSPELNRIELLWHKMKYEWLSFKTFIPDKIEQAIDEIGQGFGSKYMLTFC